MTIQSLRPMPRILFLFAAALIASSGTTQAQLEAAPTGRNFDPVAFFSGSTEGRGVLKKTFSAKQTTHVTGVGTMRADGHLIIDQEVRIEGEKIQNRHWQLHEVRPGNFSGTISDAKGVVTAAVAGNRLNISYKMKDGGMSVVQVLTMAADGRSVHNTMKIKKFGIVFATLDETIRKV
ncbi:MAG: DUF3833 family protein [Candidatus Andeanibacterium colombiense]|uniref:DUF3833 family protein n=1 Tax=Candidatus Andeanibacterium colombiense TaxID=3121345 RepID=A0AAJ6BQ93_9SPHN|nr:MAG: DUF3833 family protein [Sphingomonadaceae bacterium]